MAEAKLRVGCRVEVTGKDVFGTVAFVGATQFSPGKKSSVLITDLGKWVGVILDEPKGKNNGTVQGKRYFTCEENFGIFVRPSQLTLLDGPEGSNVMELSTSSVVSESGATSESSEAAKLSGSASSLSVGLKTPETVKGRTSKLPGLKRSPLASSTSSVKDKASVPASTSRLPSEIKKASQPTSRRSSLLPPTGSNPDLVRSSPTPTSTALKPETASAKNESSSSKPAEDKPVAADVIKSSDIMSKSYTQISKSDIPNRKISESKLPTSTIPTTGIKMPTNPSEIPQTAALRDVKAAAQKLDSENTSSKPKDTSQKLPKTSVSAATPSGTGKYSPDTELELSNLRAEVITFHEQIDALKAKREEDKNKVQELERVKIQLSQVEENRRLMREQAAELQREIAQLKTEKAEVKEAFDRYREEVSEMVENIEMATLDKEMAEEKLESLTAEIELLKEQVEELTLENQILKEESEEKGGVAVGVEGGPTPLQFKNLEQQNERMKEALVKLRDLVNQDKSEISALTKQITALESEVSQLQTEKERLTKDLKDSVEQIIELKEQVDASLGIDTMFSQLTQRNLELEELLEKTKEERNDLEILCEMNDELQENSRETELELREEIERANSQINQLVRHLDATRETISDYEQTLGKFRDLVSDLQTQNTELRRSLADGKRLQEEQQQQQNAYPTVQTDLVGATTAFMGGKFGLGSQVQTLAKVIEAELRRLEAEQTANHVTRLSAFLPDSFLRRGGDNEALLSLLLIDRLAGKCDLLANHLVERYPLPPCVPGQAPLQMPQGETSTNTTDNPTEIVSGICIPGTDNPLPPLTKTKSEFYSFITRLIHLLRSMAALLGQCKQVLSGCSVELYLKFGSLYNEMITHEHCIDRLIEQTKNDQLDETISLEPLFLSYNYFIQLYTVHLKTEPLFNCNNKLLDFTRTILSAVDALSVDSTALMILTGQNVNCLSQVAKTAATCVSGPLSMGNMDNVESLLLSTPTEGGLIGLLSELIHFSTTVRVVTRRIKRRIPNKPTSQPLSFNQDVSQKLDSAIHLLGSVVGAMYQTTRLAGQLTVRQVEDTANLDPGVVFAQCLSEACKEYLTPDASNTRSSTIAPDIPVRNNLTQVARIISQIALAMENGEYDFDGTKPTAPQEPVSARAVAYKRAQAELEGCRSKLESKAEEVRELQKALKARAEELSEMSVRVGLAEKKLETSGKGNEEKIARLEQRLEQTEAQLKRSEKEYEQTLDALQADIEALEQEKAELKEKLKTLSKKALFEGIIKTPLITGQTPPKSQTAAPATPSVESASPSPGPARLAAYRDASFMSLEIEGLREAVRRLSSEVSRLRGEKMLDQMKSLGSLKKPIRRQYLKAIDNTSKDESKPSTTEKEEEEKEQKPMISQVARDAYALQQQMLSVLANPQVVRLSKPSKPIEEPASGAGDGSTQQQQQSAKVIGPTATIQFNRQTAQLVKLRSDLEKLQQRAFEAIKTEIPNASIQADFTSFPSVKLKHLFNTENNENLPIRYRLLFPGGNDSKMNPTKVCMTREDLHILHSHLLTV